MKACNQCGKCCIKYGGADLSANPEEIALWELFNPDIYKYVNGTEIWYDPDTGERLSTCPFLAVEQKGIDNSKNARGVNANAGSAATVESQLKYTCTIYEDRPQDCRHYPTDVAEMIRDDCEMIEAVDISNQPRAQKHLDALMADSRPAKQ
ncbi:YkgJ family cysteine cluster protein [Glaciecola siphonariae]|uniref:YkgJ family cysteine cluster protein n=1 Tax=Glaciecola siphonariae TaxID=521012 RepID=A0ABV9LXD1_9ALTE